MTFSGTNNSTTLALPRPNVQPIYMKVPFEWKVNLTNQTGPATNLDSPTTPPVHVGTAGESGAMLYGYLFYGLNYEVLGAGNRAIHLYLRDMGDDRYWFHGSLWLPAAAFGAMYAGTFPQLVPNQQRGFMLPPYGEMYAALNAPMTEGMNFCVMGGSFS